MDFKKAEKLEKHKKEIKHRAYLNLFLTLIAGVGIGIVLGGPVTGILNLLVGDNATIATVLVLLGFGGLVYMTPLFHYKEKVKAKSDRNPDYYLETGLDKTPLVQLAESQGWEEVKSTEDKITLEIYPSTLHKLVGRKSTMEVEILERDENHTIAVLRKDGKEIEKIKSTIEPESEGSIINGTGISLERTSPAYLELLLFILPQIQDTLKEAAEEKLEIVDENIEYSFSKFNLNAE